MLYCDTSRFYWNSAATAGKNGEDYKNAAIKMLASLSSDKYQYGEKRPRHSSLSSSKHLPNNSKMGFAAHGLLQTIIISKP